MSPVGNSEGFEELICWKIGLKPLLKTWISHHASTLNRYYCPTVPKDRAENDRV